ncbi:MAG: hypothetical protein ACYDCQ_15755 [Dehalococcoidia bacterium]
MVAILAKGTVMRYHQAMLFDEAGAVIGPVLIEVTMAYSGEARLQAWTASLRTPIDRRFIGQTVRVRLPDGSGAVGILKTNRHILQAGPWIEAS